MTGRLARKPDSAFAGRREVPRRDAEVGCYFARGMSIFYNDRPGRPVINDDCSCATYEKERNSEERELSVKHWDLISCFPPWNVNSRPSCGNLGRFFRLRPAPPPPAACGRPPAVSPRFPRSRSSCRIESPKHGLRARARGTKL